MNLNIYPIQYSRQHKQFIDCAIYVLTLSIFFISIQFLASMWTNDVTWSYCAKLMVDSPFDTRMCMLLSVSIASDLLAEANAAFVCHT